VAIKSIPLKLVEDVIDLVEQELKILHEVDHPHIVKVYETYKDKRFFHIVMEFCKGTELFEALSERETFSERDAC
jgi:serine/threonine protein kinase